MLFGVELICFLEKGVTMKRTLDLTIIMDRIKTATPDSPIAVFKSDKGLDCVFANTVITEERVDDEDCIGSYHGKMDMNYILDNLSKIKRCTI